MFYGHGHEARADARAIIMGASSNTTSAAEKPLAASRGPVNARGSGIFRVALLGVLGVLLTLSGHAAGQDPAPGSTPGSAPAPGPVPAPGSDTATIRFIVTVPDDTPVDAHVYLSGDHDQMGRWNGQGLELKRHDDGTYRGSLTFKRGTHVRFKATRGSWQTVEKNDLGGEIDNRTLIADKDKQVKAVVAAWATPGARPHDRPEPSLTGDIRRHDGFHSDILDNDRTLLVYLPPGYDDQPGRRFPVLYMHDGQNLFDASTSFAGHEWQVDEAAERLISNGDIEPIIIVGIYNNADRMAEYTPRPDGDKPDAYARFVVQEVKPFIDRTYRSDPAREKTGVAGSSLGGLISLYMAREYADTFGRCAALSPSLWWNDRWLLGQWQARDTGWMTHTRFWIDVGTDEGRAEPGEAVRSSVTNARDLAGLFDRAGLKRGAGYQYLEVQGAKHNEQAWSARIQRVLTFLYGR
jgi:predicted alpha/beta superfamily hydrolase